MSQTDRSFKYLTHTVHAEAQRAALQAFTLQSGLQIDATVKIALRTAVDAAIVSMTESPTDQMAAGTFSLGDRVRKTKGSSWQGRIVGFYNTELTPIGYAVESEREPGSVQIYPEAALTKLEDQP